MTNLTKQEQAEALAMTKYPEYFNGDWVKNVPDAGQQFIKIYGEAIRKRWCEDEIPNVERLNANGFEIVKKGGEDGC